MFSFLVKSRNAWDYLTPGTSDKNPIQHTVHNSVEPVEEDAAVKEEDVYQWFTYQSSKPVSVDFRGKPIEIKKGTKFGVRPSANKKNIRLIFPGDKTRVITISPEQAKQLAKGV